MSTEKRVEYRENAPIPPEPKPPKENAMLKFFQYIHQQPADFFFSCLFLSFVTGVIYFSFVTLEGVRKSDSGAYTFCYLDTDMPRSKVYLKGHVSYHPDVDLSSMNCEQDSCVKASSEMETLIQRYCPGGKLGKQP